MADIAALDFRFADDRIEVIRFNSPWALLDYDIVIWNPANLLSNYYKRGPNASRFQGLPALARIVHEETAPRVIQGAVSSV